MSSAILYLAIIAIWACVLVPGGIHKPHRILPEPEKLFGLQHSAASGAPDAETGEMAGDGWDDRGDSTEVLPGVAGQGPVPRRPGTTSAADHAGHAHDRGPGGHGREALSRVVPGASGRHARRVSAAAARGHACRRGAGTVAS